MRPPHLPDKEFVCVGSTVVFGDCRGRQLVHETPREARELMRNSEEDMIELHHIGDIEVPCYFQREEIVAILPYWDEVED